MEKEFEALVKMDNLYCAICPHKSEKGKCTEICEYNKQSNIIKQALLKVQEFEKAYNDVKALPLESLIETYKKDVVLDIFTKETEQLKKENEQLKEIIKCLFDRGCPLHQYTDKDFGLTIEVDSDCSIMHLGEFKGVDLDQKLKEVLEWAKN